MPDSIADVETLARAAGHRPPGPWSISLDGRIDAGVCVPLHLGERGLEVWLIKRPDDMRHHPREIAFPGGRRDDDDADLSETAVRELEEELGVPRARVRVLGPMAPVPTATSRFTLNPYVALVEQGTVAVPHAGEVAVMIELPLADFFAGAVPYRAVELAPGRRSPIFDLAAGSMYGASAHVLDDLLRAYAELRGLPFPEPVLTDRIPWG